MIDKDKKRTICLTIRYLREHSLLTLYKDNIIKPTQPKSGFDCERLNEWKECNGNIMDFLMYRMRDYHIMLSPIRVSFSWAVGFGGYRKWLKINNESCSYINDIMGYEAVR